MYNSFHTFRVGYRIKSYLEQQLQSCTTVNDHHRQVPLQPSSSTAVVFPTSGWISGFMNVLENGVAISRSFIYAYMVDRVSSERDPSNNFCALKTGYNLFVSGHVQSIHMCTNMSYCFYKAAILPSMNKEKPYNVLCAIHLASKQVHCAHCSCPAGESQSCVHLSAMLHALECLFETPYKAILVGTAVGESKTSFDCTWLKPRKRKIAATCADVLHYIRHEYGKTHKRKCTDADFDPRPPSKCSATTVEEGRQILAYGLKGTGTCAELLLQ